MKLENPTGDHAPPEPTQSQNGGAAVTTPPGSGDPIESAERPTPGQYNECADSVSSESSPEGDRLLSIPEGINDLSLPQAARFYIDKLGLAVIPLHPITSKKVKKPGKAPMIRGYRKKTVAHMTDEYLAKWFPERTDRNLGGILQSEHLCVDFDAKEDEGASADEWLEQHPKFKNYPRVRTKHGFHLHFIVRDLPRNAKKLAHTVSEKLVIEVFPPTYPVTLPPSLRIDGQPYVWEKVGPLPDIMWNELLSQLEIPETKPGRPRKPRPFSQKFKGDLRTLDLVALLREKEMLGDCIDEEEGKFAVRCAWEHEHSERHEDIGSDTAIWNSPGKTPSYNCFHSHCHDRKIEHLLEWLESQDPGVVDRFCRKRWFYDRSERDGDNGKPLVEHPGAHRLISKVAEELVSVIAPRHTWFQRGGGIVEITHNPQTGRPRFRLVSVASACGGIEEFVVPVVPMTNNDVTIMVPLSFYAKEISPLLQAPQFYNKLPVIERILSVPLPVLNDDGTVARPQQGYDPNLRTYLDPDAPKIEAMTVVEAKQLLDDILKDFCFASDQDRVHAIARLLTPYVRGVLGWTARVPLWLYLANRPRAGKDYLAGVVSLVYTGELLEDAPLEKGSEETRKRITAALMAGRGFMHLANCQGHINDATLIGAITARVLRVRNLGSTAANADLELQNEIEFSMSANVGVTYREDIEPRTRRITLAFYDEDPNKRSFRYPDLHAHVRSHRGKILGAFDAYFTEWIRQGMPAGATPFTSFPEWARVVGGIMISNGLGDPCLPHETELELGGDLKERAMRAVYRIGFAKWPNKWAAKEQLFNALAEADDEDLLWFGAWMGDDAKGTRNKAGMALKAYKQRVLGGICLSIDENGKGSKQKIRFTAEDGGSPSEGGNLGNLGNLVCPDSQEKQNLFNKIQTTMDFLPQQPAAEVSKVSQVSSPPYQLVTDASEFTAVAAALSAASSVALDTETYGPGKTGALNPRKGRIRLLQLAVLGHEPWLIDIKKTGEDLGPLKAALESTEVIAHNARFDLGFLREHLGIAPNRVYCTMTASQVLTNGTKNCNKLSSCLERHLGVPPYPDQSTSDWGTHVLTRDQLEYAACDVIHLYSLRNALVEELEAAGLSRVTSIEMELLPAVVDMMAAGVLIHRERLQRYQAEALNEAQAAQNELQLLTGNPSFNPGSVKQVTHELDSLGLDLPNTKAETLVPHADNPFVSALLRYRRRSKLAQTLRSLDREIGPDGRIHASFNPLGTVTGRFSSSGPNMQNLPRGEIRSMVRPPEGYDFIKADYSQIELRAVAALAPENNMLEAFRNGADIHLLTASRITGKPVEEITPEERQEAKPVNFGFLYGQGSEGFRKKALADYGIDFTAERADELRQAYFDAYPGILHWHEEGRAQANRGIREVRTLTGRRHLLRRDARFWSLFTAAVNSPVQGVAADGMKLALTRLHRDLPDGTRVVLTVHDDVLIECPKNLTGQVRPVVEQVMTEEMSALLPEVPIEVEAEVLDEWK